MKKILVAFDYDDTLVDTRRAKYSAIQALAEREYDVRVTAKQLDDVWGCPYRLLFETIFSNSGVDVDQAIAKYESMDKEFPIAAFPDMVESINSIAVQSSVCIVSSCGRRQLLTQLNSIFPSHPFQPIFAADDTAFHKPDPRVFDRLLDHLRNTGREGFEVVYVGDSPKDMHAARNAGFRFIGVARIDSDKSEMLAAGAEVAESLTEVALMLRGAGNERFADSDSNE